MEDINFAKLDISRKDRTGFPETVFCQGKADEHLAEIFCRLYERNGEVLGTRATEAQYRIVHEALPAAIYDKTARISRAGAGNKELIGNSAVCTAWTADIPVAEEAALTAEFFGGRVERVYDVGVSGIHRLLSQTERLNAANVIIAIAGMEGALASVIGGLVSVPVIAVPTSVGYGASFGGLSALLTMINSCANGISVVNIDTGYGAAYIASQINRQPVKAKVR